MDRMGDSLHSPNSSRNLETRVIFHRKQPIIFLVASASKGMLQGTFKCVTAVKRHIQGNPTTCEIVAFLLKTAALEVVRRFSRARCTFIWHALQALQIFSYPPFSWLGRWGPFKGFIKHTKKLSRPMLVLSIATVFSDQSTWHTDTSHVPSGTPESSVPRSDLSSHVSDTDKRDCDEVSEAETSEQWLLDLHMELKKQGIVLPERISDDELRRFYSAVSGDFSKLLSSVKKAIIWRQNYKLLSRQELDAWSHLVFWHGHDVNLRPCLIIRLGLACSNLSSNDRNLFMKAVVSQIEYGVLNLVNVDQHQIMVLMDCDGLSPFGFPLQTMRSCAMLLQDYYPNRLGCLIITRLPQIARVITQALFQVLKPATQRKVKVVGGNYRTYLSEFLESIPPFLGGDCSCSKCSNICTTELPDVEFDSVLPINNSMELDHIPAADSNEDWKRLKRVIAVGFLMFCIFIIFMPGMHPEKLFHLYSKFTVG